MRSPFQHPTLTLTAGAVALALVVLASPAMASSAAPQITHVHALPRLLGQRGGVVQISANVRSAQRCHYTLGARHGSVSCAGGRFVLTLRIAANTTPSPATLALRITARDGAAHASTTTLLRQAGHPAAPTPTAHTTNAPPVVGLDACSAGPHCDYGPIYASYNAFDNAPPQSLGDCTFAAAANWEQITLGVHVSPALVEQEFAAAGGATDGISQDGLWNDWTTTGINGLLLTGLHSFFTDRADVEAGVRRYAAMIVEFHFTSGDRFAQYTVTGGYHDAVVDGFTPQGPLVVSWGQTMQLTWRQWHTEAIAMWSPSTGG